MEHSKCDGLLGETPKKILYIGKKKNLEHSKCDGLLGETKKKILYIGQKVFLESDQVTDSVCLDYDVECSDFYILEFCQECSVLPHGVHQRVYLIVSDAFLSCLVQVYPVC